jgi:hypothetical protein
MKDTYINQLGSLSSKINSLQQQRMSEEQKMNQWSGNLFSQLTGVNSGLSNARVSDLAGLNNYKSQLDSLLASKNAFTSPILGDYTPFTMTQLDTTYQSALDRYNALMGQRDSELKRAADYEKSILDKAASFQNMYGGLDIANEAGINALPLLLAHLTTISARSLATFSLWKTCSLNSATSGSLSSPELPPRSRTSRTLPFSWLLAHAPQTSSTLADCLTFRHRSLHFREKWASSLRPCPPTSVWPTTSYPRPSSSSSSFLRSVARQSIRCGSASTLQLLV